MQGIWRVTKGVVVTVLFMVLVIMCERNNIRSADPVIQVTSEQTVKWTFDRARIYRLIDHQSKVVCYAVEQKDKRISALWCKPLGV